MNLTLIALLLALSLFVFMLVFIGVGRRIGINHLRQRPDGLAKGTGASEGAVFGLLGLIIAFTFSGAATRFEARRHLVTEEVNAIGTAYLRIEVLPEDARVELRSLFRRYLELRIATYENVEDQAATLARLDETEALQGVIWSKAVIATQRPDTKGRPEGVVLPALNDMFDIVTTRKAATLNHPPRAVYLLLGVLCLVSALLVGYGISSNTRRSWLHAVVFAAITSISIFVIIDVEYPRLGLIRVDSSDQLMRDLRKSIHE